MSVLIQWPDRPQNPHDGKSFEHRRGQTWRVDLQDRVIVHEMSEPCQEMAARFHDKRLCVANIHSRCREIVRAISPISMIAHRNIDSGDPQNDAKTEIERLSCQNAEAGYEATVASSHQAR